MTIPWLAIVLALAAPQSDVSALRKRMLEILDQKIGGFQRTAIGVSRRGSEITAFISDEDLDLSTKRCRVLLVSGLGGSNDPMEWVTENLEWFRSSPRAAEYRRRFAISAVPSVFPDGPATPEDLSLRNCVTGFPHGDRAYGDKSHGELMYLWRWIGMHAPDLVVVVHAKSPRLFEVPKSHERDWATFAGFVGGVALVDTEDELFAALQNGSSSPSETGSIPALNMNVLDRKKRYLADLFEALEKSRFSFPSPARKELERRLERTPLEVARQLSKVYGHSLKQVVYIPAIALIGRLRLGELDGDPSHLAEVERIVNPYRDGEKKSAPRSGSSISGHLIFCELARLTTGERRARYTELAKAAADLGFDDDGQPRASMPFHSQMSDALFMGGPILSRVGKLTADGRYHDACARHLRFMRKLVLRDDGLYRHSPLDEAAWGRGNGFPALGLAMCLTDMPDEHPERVRLLEWFRAHMRALVKHQDPTGCWHQVIDKVGSYRELTSTCMITFSMVRGVREGWLDSKEYEPVIGRAWYAIRTRVAPNGRLVDVCAGTGKQKSLRAYYDRPAILGRDDRGGAMALLVATEIARWKTEDGSSP